jgi:branched-chain amino acid transport system permease protein
MFTMTSNKRRLATFVIIGWVLLLVSDRVSTLRLYQGSYVATYTLAVASIILLTGYSGQLSLGHGALMAVGAYAGALAIDKAMLNPVLGLVVATLVSGIFGLILGFAVARLSGPYLAGTTLALAVALPTLANEFEILGGQQGLPFDVGSSPERFGEEFSQYKWYFWRWKIVMKHQI